MIRHIGESSTVATVSVPVSNTLRYLSVNGSQGFQTVAYWHSMGLPDFNICGIGHGDSGTNAALIPVTTSVSGTISRVSFRILAYASNARVRTFLWRIASGRTDLGQGQTLRSGQFTCPYGTNYVTVDCPGTVPSTFYIYLEPWTQEYGNIHITDTVTVTVYTQAQASAYLSATPKLYHNGAYRSGTIYIYHDGAWRTGR